MSCVSPSNPYCPDEWHKEEIFCTTYKLYYSLSDKAYT